MIKKYLLGLGIVVLGFLGFSEAKIQDVGLLKYPSTVDQNFSIGFIKGGGVITDYLGTNKSVMALDKDTIFWWSTNGMPYFYSEGVNTIQGFFDSFYSCDNLTTIDTLPENCVLGGTIDYSGDLSQYKDLFKNFFSQVVQDDLVYYGYTNTRYVGSTLDYVKHGIDVCWSSEIIGKSLCFRGMYCSASNYSYCNSYRFGNFVNSQNLSNLSFGNVSNNWIGYAPGQKGYGGDYSGSGNISDSSSQGDNVSVGGNVVYGNCTNGQALQWYRDYIGINDYVCYGGLDSFNYYTGDYLVTPGKGLTVFDLYEYENFNGFYSGFNDWLQTRSYNYTQYINGNSNTTFDSDPTVFKTYFGILYRTFGPAREIHDYCRLLINSDLNGNLRDNPYIPSSVKNELCENIVNSDTVENPGQSSNDSGTIVSSDWSGIGNSNVSGSNLSGGNPVYDGTNFINTYFNKLKGNSSNPEGTGNGIIPGYIIVALMGVIFFKFLRK